MPVRPTIHGTVTSHAVMTRDGRVLVRPPLYGPRLITTSEPPTASAAAPTAPSPNAFGRTSRRPCRPAQPARQICGRFPECVFRTVPHDRGAPLFTSDTTIARPATGGAVIWTGTAADPPRRAGVCRRGLHPHIGGLVDHSSAHGPAGRWGSVVGQHAPMGVRRSMPDSAAQWRGGHPDRRPTRCQPTRLEHQVQGLALVEGTPPSCSPAVMRSGVRIAGTLHRGDAPGTFGTLPRRAMGPSRVCRAGRRPHRLVRGRSRGGGSAGQDFPESPGQFHRASAAPAQARSPQDLPPPRWVPFGEDGGARNFGPPLPQSDRLLVAPFQA